MSKTALTNMTVDEFFPGHEQSKQIYAAVFREIELLKQSEIHIIGWGEEIEGYYE